ELSFRETIRRLFGEKSPEYQAHKNHKLRVGSRAESAQSTALIKQLIAALANQKADILGLKSASPATAPPTVSERPALSAVPPGSPSDSLVPPKAAPPAAVALHSAPLTVSVAMTTSLSAPAQAIAPIIMTAPLSEKPVSACTAPVGYPQPVGDTSMPRQPLSSSPHSETTQSGSGPGSLDEKKSVLATPPEGPATPTPPAQESVAASSDLLEQPSTTTAVIQTAASHRPVIPQQTIPPIPPATQHAATASALPTESLLPLRTAPEAADPLVYTPTPILPPPPASIESLAPALIESPPQDTVNATVSKRTIEALPTEPPSVPGPTAAESVTPAVERLVTPQTFEVPQKTTTQSNETETGTLDMLRRICARFHLVARQLRLRKEYRPTIEITDEYDLQDLFYALLRLQFDEVGTEELAPGYANGARRTSYLLDWDRIVVVVKQTRSGLSTKDLSEQVKSDAAHYSIRPNGITLLCFIYDPEGRVGNPRGLEADLTSVSDTYMVEVIVAPK
ncbi:MAG: hypothetical protein ABI856_04850, partial [Nitrospira sp.]